jgi:tRNA (guanine-N7-)-methyltransferase
VYHSKIVTTNQAGLHPRLEQTVVKHLQTKYLKPYQQHNLGAFEVLQEKRAKFNCSGLILDSGCGTAMSSIKLASANPGSLVIGIDQSLHRLNKANDNVSLPQNLLLLQANCEDMWRLCVKNSIQFDEHYILYPNPWPKSVHLQRRWHGHPVFPTLKPLAKKTIVRSNWRLYLQEFGFAWQLLSGNLSEITSILPAQYLSLFEKKYHLSDQPLYQLSVI